MLSEISPKAIQLFNAKTVKTKSCWIWCGFITEKGYGRVHIGRETCYAHALSWMIFNKMLVPEGLEVRHTCDVRYCVNPQHLLVGTHTENLQDMQDRNRRAHNFKGHRNPTTHLSPTDVENIKLEYGQGRKFGITQREIGKKYGISNSSVSKIWLNQTWKN